MAGPEEAGERLDAFLARRDGRFSRNRFKALIKDGQVTIGGRTLSEPNYWVKPGDVIAFTVPEPEDATPQPEAIALNVVFEDADLIVIDKPAGLVVHPAAGNWAGTLVNALIHHCGDSLSGIGGVRRPGIVHRLDKETSGLIVVAKSDPAHRGLAAQFADHGRNGPMRRAYLALVWGAPMPAKGMIDAPLERDKNNRLKRAVVKSGGNPAAGPRSPAMKPSSAFPPTPLSRLSPRWSVANWKPAAPTRSACIWPISAIRWSATRSMAPGS
jgi:23S rRNA pseudouridine1911/1915/1917 synthase